MIEPSNIIKVDTNTEPSIINIQSLPEYDTEDYDIYDDKDFKHYISDIEKLVRGSFEYKQFIAYLREYMDMDKSYYFSNIDNKDKSKMKIEIHHTPFDLYSIVLAVFNKRLYYNEDLSVEMVAKEVMALHYKCIVGLVPLSQTEHELVHNKYLFIPIIDEEGNYTIFGRYELFVDYYKEFMTQEELNTLENIELYSKTYGNTIEEKSPLIQNEVYIDCSAYSVPDFQNIQLVMKKRAQQIKDNGYQLPTLEDKSYNVNKYNNNTPPKNKSIEICHFIH